MTSIAVLTTVRGRLDHLVAQASWLDASAVLPDEHVVVWMGGPDPHQVLRAVERPVRIVPLDEGFPLPLARARNLAARTASSDVLVFLDVDCLPSPGMLAAYQHHAAPGVVLAGPVGYLPEWVEPLAVRAGDPSFEVLRGFGVHPPDRPRPGGKGTTPVARVELLWSLSMAVRREDFVRVGGFDEAYRGYGAEDTDFARRVQRAGLQVRWCPAADAVHLHHPVSDPPVEHVADIVANARRYRSRWGEWPMTGWLTAFREQGLVEWDHDGDLLRLA